MSIVARSGHRGPYPRNGQFGLAMRSVAHNFLTIALSGIDMRRLIVDVVALNDVLARDHEAEARKTFGAFRGPCINITSKYAMRIR